MGFRPTVLGGERFGLQSEKTVQPRGCTVFSCQSGDCFFSRAPSVSFADSSLPEGAI